MKSWINWLKIGNISQFNQRKSISLQILLITPFVLQVFGVVALVGYFSFRNGQKSVQNLAEQLMLRNQNFNFYH